MSEEIIKLNGDAMMSTQQVGASVDLTTETPTPVVPAVPVTTPERRAMLKKIAQYKAIFTEEVADLDISPPQLANKSEQELESILADVVFNVETRRSTAQSRGLFLASMSIVESGGGLIGMELKGLAGVCSQSPDLLRNVDECALKYQKIVQLDPVARLGLSIAQLCIALDQSNRRQGIQASTVVPPQSNVTKEEQVATSGKSEFADL